MIVFRCQQWNFFHFTWQESNMKMSEDRLSNKWTKMFGFLGFFAICNSELLARIGGNNNYVVCESSTPLLRLCLSRPSRSHNLCVSPEDEPEEHPHLSPSGRKKKTWKSVAVGTASSATSCQHPSSTPSEKGGGYRHRHRRHPAQTQARVSEANKSRRLVVEASISKFKYLTEQVSGPFVLAKKSFFSGSRQAASIWDTHIFLKRSCQICAVGGLWHHSRCSGNRQIKRQAARLAAPVDCADGGGALIICHLSVWLLGLGLSIIVVITFNWIHGIICNEPKFPHHRPSLDG